MTELIDVKNNKSLRYFSTALYVFVFIITIILSALAGPGSGPFQQSTGDVSDLHNLCITPASYTFSIWGFIYIVLGITTAYSIFILFYKVENVKIWQLGGAITVPFLLVMTINLIMNVSWLFAWDANNMLAAAILLIIIATTNATCIILMAKAFKASAANIYEKSKMAFFMNIFVMNAVATYAMWTVIACLLNIGILIVDNNRTDSVNEITLSGVRENVCIVILSVLLAAIIVHFVLEQGSFKKFLNGFIMHYLVYLWASVGVYMKNIDSSTDTVGGLIIANISMAAIFSALRIAAQFCGNWKNKIYFPQ